MSEETVPAYEYSEKLEQMCLVGYGEMRMTGFTEERGSSQC